jgi:hypothetical protein
VILFVFLTTEVIDTGSKFYPCSVDTRVQFDICVVDSRGKPTGKGEATGGVWESERS